MKASLTGNLVRLSPLSPLNNASKHLLLDGDVKEITVAEQHGILLL